jgi:hypothetical protein
MLSTSDGRKDLVKYRSSGNRKQQRAIPFMRISRSSQTNGEAVWEEELERSELLPAPHAPQSLSDE